MKRHKVLENDQYTVWTNAKQVGAYTSLTFDIQRPAKNGTIKVEPNKFELYLLPHQLREFTAFLHSL